VVVVHNPANVAEARDARRTSARTVPRLTPSRPTEGVDRCSDCRPMACERPVGTSSFSSEWWPYPVLRCSGLGLAMRPAIA
jgi:hypothetical protein